RWYPKAPISSARLKSQDGHGRTATYDHSRSVSMGEIIGPKPCWNRDKDVPGNILVLIGRRPSRDYMRCVHGRQTPPATASPRVARGIPSTRSALSSSTRGTLAPSFAPASQVLKKTAAPRCPSWIMTDKTHGEHNESGLLLQS